MRLTVGYPQMPPSLQLRSYQQQAIESWFANKGRGTLKMATGSGKTIAALAIAGVLIDGDGRHLIRISQLVRGNLET